MMIINSFFLEGITKIYNKSQRIVISDQRMNIISFQSV